jgi:PAS domain S-box-containing protein
MEIGRRGSEFDAFEQARINGTTEDPALDRITDLASKLYRVPVSTVCVLQETRICFKSHYGIEVSETDRQGSLPDFVAECRATTVIPDVLRHPHFEARPPTIGGMRIRFFAGTPLLADDGHPIGVLSIMDTRPREGLSVEETEMLEDLAALVMDELKLQLELSRARLTSRSLEESEGKFRALMETASQGIIGVNHQGAIRLVNRKAEELYGYTRDELIGQQIEILIPEPVREKHVAHRAAYFEHPRARPMGIGLELRGRHRNGNEFPVEISLNYLTLEGESLAISFITDITERTRLEQQLRHAQKMEAIGQLAGGVAHDFNNLLTVISGYTALGLETLAPEDPLRAPLEEIGDAALRASALTGQLLAFSRKQLVKPNVFNLNDRVVQMHKMLRRLIGEHIQLELALDQTIGPIRADPGQIDQVIINLVLNARDAMPKGGHLLVETAPLELGAEYAGTHLSVQPGPHIMLAVTDSGTGMTPEVQSRLFEPFFTTKEAGKGTGLGLATVYGIVKQAAGTIFVYSEQDRGSTFKILFPRVEAKIDVPLEPEQFRPVGRGETVLLVEDDEPVRKFVRTLLQDGGYRVVEAADVDEAVRALDGAASELELVLTDVVMPKMTGPELVDVLRKRMSDLKAVYMSGYTDGTVPINTDPNAAFIQKPFTPAQLHQKIAKMLGKS